MYRLIGIFFAVLLWIPGMAAAQEAGRVVAMSSPAWVVSGSRVRALTPKQALSRGDSIRTGRGGRVLLILADGAEVRLGEGADFQLQRFEESASEPNFFSGALNVLKGAFRYTTRALASVRRRDVKITISGITVGIRGTDVWGRAAPDKDIFCLIEGAVDVRRGDEPPFAMDQPLTFYIAPKNASALPIAPVDPDRLAGWAAEVDLDEAAGVLSEVAGFGVVLESNRSANNASDTRERYIERGFPANVEPTDVAGVRYNRVVVRGFADASAAAAFAARIAATEGAAGAFVIAPR